MSGQPYTHDMHAARCKQACMSKALLIQFVQVQSRTVTYCARIRDVWTTPDGLDLWKVELLGPGAGEMFVPTKRTRQCSGLDGRCLCAGEDVRAAAAAVAATRSGGAEGAVDDSVFFQAGVVAPPESLIFEKTPVSEGF